MEEQFRIALEKELTKALAEARQDQVPVKPVGGKRKKVPLRESFARAQQDKKVRVLQEQLKTEQIRVETLSQALMGAYAQDSSSPARIEAGHLPAEAGSLLASMRAWIKEKRPPNTSKTYASAVTGSCGYDEFCQRNGLSHVAHKPEVLVACMKEKLEQGKAQSTINNTLVSAVSDKYRYSAENPATSQLVKDAKRIVAQNTPAPKKRKEVPRETFAALLDEILRQTAATMVPIARLYLARDALMFLSVYKLYTRPDGAVNLDVEDVTVETIYEDDKQEEVLQAVIRDGKNNRGGEPHVALLASGIDPRFDLIRWFKMYTLLEESVRAELKLGDRPKSLFYALGGRTPGARLKPQTINKRLQRYKGNPALAGIDMDGITAYCFRTAGVSQAIRLGVNLRLVQRHGNWKSMAVLAYVNESIEQRLEVSRVL